MNVSEFLPVLREWALGTGIKILGILILTVIAVRVMRVLSKKLSVLFSKHELDDESKKRAETLASVIRHVLNVVILLLAAMMILGQLGVEIGPILAAAGIFGLAIGFGAQSLVKDVINGFFILLENQIRVGDIIEIGGVTGQVEKINLKITILRDALGNVHYIPNGTIDRVTNKTKDFSRYIFEIGVSYNENVDEVMEVIREVDQELRGDPDFQESIENPIEVFGVDQFADSAVIIKARTTTKPGKQWGIAREFNRRLKHAFDRRNIEIPYPHLTLYMGQGKEGDAPPIRVKTESS